MPPPTASDADTNRLKVSQAPSLTGRALGDFVVKQKLGEGGVGAAYLAEQTVLGREAVIKVLLDGNAADPMLQSRFLREARLASRIEHPYAVQIFAFGAEPDGLLWLAMELVRGVSLSEWLTKNGPMPLERFAPFFDALCDTVEALHEKGIVHRDIKPSNVMVSVRNGRLLPKLLDLGIATVVKEARAEPLSDSTPHSMPLLDAGQPLAGASTPPRSLEDTGLLAAERLDTEHESASEALGYRPSLTPLMQMPPQAPPLSVTPSMTLNRIRLAENLSITRESDAVGSPMYMSPEQWLNSRDATGQADIYSLGILAWQCLTGRATFTARTTTGMAMQHLHAPIPKLPEGLPSSLQSIFSKALAKEASARYLKAGDFGRAVLEAEALTHRAMPMLPEGIRREWVDAAPQPLAEALAVFEGLSSPKEGLDAARKVLVLLPRFLALLGLLSRQRLGPGEAGAEDALAPLVGALRNGRLEQHGWLSLLWHVVSPWSAQRTNYPVPGLISFCVAPQPGNIFEKPQRSDTLNRLIALEPLLEAAPANDDEALTRYESVIMALSAILQAASFLLRTTMARATRDAGIFESYAGVRRPIRSRLRARLPSAEEGGVFLFDEQNVPLLRLSPLVQVLEPSPGEPLEVFSFSGAGRNGARLVAAPREFERQDEALWAWFYAIWPRNDSPQEHRDSHKAPYRGLASFTAADSQDFFGRELEAGAVANRLRVKPFLAVVGPSGVGKSSFVQAGVAPLFSSNLTVVVVRPGNTPLVTLVAKLEALGIDVAGLTEAILEDPAAMGRRLAEHAGSTSTKYLLVVDQFEELLTLCRSQAERESYAGALVTAAASSEDRVRVLLTMRDDFLIRAQGLEALRDSLSTGLTLLSTPNEHDLLRILTEPLKRVGYAFEDAELPKQMVKEVMHQPGALALLSFSATRLWEARDTHFRRLTRQAYQAMGGVGGALAGHAEETLGTMTEQERLVTRELFRHLVSSSGTRAVLSRKEALELAGDSTSGARVLEKLIDARLLVTSEEEGGDDRVEIIHEALLSSWPRLVLWQRENAEVARVRDSLRVAARQWQEQGRPRGMLWRDETLTEYRVWRPRYAGALTHVETAFAAASLNEFERGRRIRRALLVAAFAVLSIGLIAVIRANGRAHEKAIESQHRLTLMTADKGRVAFLAGRPAEAFSELSAAADAGYLNPGVASMLRKSAKSLAAEKQFADLGANVATVVVSPTGEVAAGTAAGTLSLFEGETLRPIGNIAAFENATARAVRYFASGKRVLVCGADGLVTVLDTQTHARIGTLRVGMMPLSTCELAQGETALVAAGTGSKTHLLTFENGVLLEKSMHQFDSTGVSAVVFDPQRTRYIATMDATVGPPPEVKRHPIEDIDGTLVWLEGLTGPVRSAVWSADGRGLFTGGFDGLITEWDAVTGRRKRTLSGHRSPVIALALSADGSRLFSGGVAGTMQISDAVSGERLVTVQAHEGRLGSLKLVADKQLILTSGADGVVRMWSMMGQLRKTLPPQTGGVAGFDVDSNRERVYVGSVDGFVRSYDLMAVDFERELPVPRQPLGFALDRDEKRLVVGQFSGPLIEYDLTRDEPPVLWPVNIDEDRAFALSGDGQSVATDRGDMSEVISRTGEVTAKLTGHPGAEAYVLMSSKKTHVLMLGNYVTPLLADVRTGQLRALPAPGVRSGAAAFSGTGSDVWLGTTVGEIIWWPETGAPRVAKISRTLVLSVAESPDGRWLVAATFDQRIHVLRTETLEEVASAATGISGLFTGFSSDDALLALGDSSGAVQTWGREPLELIDSRKVGQRLLQLTTLRTKRSLMTLTPDGLLVWAF